VLIYPRGYGLPPIPGEAGGTSFAHAQASGVRLIARAAGVNAQMAHAA